MASILKVDDLRGITAAGNITITSEGGAATMQLQQGVAKQWVRFSGTSMSVADSFNTSSVTDNGTGDYSPVLTCCMSSENYSPLYTTSQYHELMGNNGGTTGTLASGYKINIRNSSNSAADTGRVSSAVFGDLA